MRNLSILFLLVLLSLLGCQSSKKGKAATKATSMGTIKHNALYKPFSEFKGDTLQYLNYNFVDHKDQYIGKTFSVLYHDLEIPVKSSASGIDHSNQLVSPSLTLAFYDDGTTTYRMNNDNLPSYFVIVKWEKPLSSEALFKLDQANNLNWSSSHETFLANEIIKDVAVLKYIDPQSKKQ